MNPGRRAALFRVVTASTAILSAILASVHFTGREEALREARSQVERIHEDARRTLKGRVYGMIQSLGEWRDGRPVPEGFRDVQIVTEPKGWQEIEGSDLRTPPYNIRVEKALVQIVPADTGVVREREAVLRDASYQALLDFPGAGKGTLRVVASVEAGAPAGAGPVVLPVRIEKGPLTVETLGELRLVPGAEPVERTFPLAVENTRQPPRLQFPLPPGASPVRVHWTARIGSDAGVVREDTGTVKGGLYTRVLEFRDPGRGTLWVSASVPAADPASPSGDAPIPVTVAIVSGGQDREVLGELAPVPGREAAERTFEVALKEVDPVRPQIQVTVPAGSPPVNVQWKAYIGGSQQAEVGEVAIAVPLADAAIVLAGEEAARPGQPGRTVRAYAQGLVPLERLTRGLTDAHPLRTEEMGDRLYLTDASGTVVMSFPDLPPKVGRRIRQGQEGRGALSSLATLRVKLRTPGSDSYEGFGKDQVIGAFLYLPEINGGLIVEREEKHVLAPWRGLQAWHVTFALMGLLILYPLVPPLVAKIKEDTELPRLLAYARAYVPHMGGILGASVLYAAGKSAYAYYTKVVTDEVLLSGESTAIDRLVAICWVLVAVALGMFVVNWVKEYLGKLIQNRLVVDLRCILCEKIVQLPMSYHSRQRAGDLLSRIQNDVAETKRGLEMLFDDVMTEPIMLFGLVATAFYINWRLALIVFVGLPIILVPISYFGKSIKRHARKRQAKKADVTHTINQMLSGIRVVKAFRMEEHEARRIRKVSNDFLSEAMRVARSQVTSKEFLEFVQNLSGVVVLALGGYLVLDGQVTVGDLMAFLVLIANMYRSSKQLTSTYNKMQESLAGTERIFEVLDTPDHMADRPNARALVRPRREVAFENVWFRYGEDQPWVLRDVSFRTPVGRTVALVGATGAGKSTMLDLVARFYDPDDGRITIDGIDLRDYSRTSLMSQVAVVTQEPFLFNASIGENLRYGKTGAGQTEVEAAARAAFVHEEILKQSEGYDTVVGERGGRLSGGQRQRMTIARAILKDPPILILDEATSALDSRAEKMVQDALNNLMRDRTTFVIAHRLSTIQHADTILVLEGGRIAEQGSHEELLRIPGGIYRRLYEIQFASALEGGEGASEGPERSVAG